MAVATTLRIQDACPHCGQQVLVQLAATAAEAGRVTVPVIVDPNAVAALAAAPTADHPCPSAGAPESETRP